MKKNVGSADKIIRVSLAVIILILIAAQLISGALLIILGIAAVLFLATSLMGFCPVYFILKLTTKKDTANVKK